MLNLFRSKHQTEPECAKITNMTSLELRDIIAKHKWVNTNQVLSIDFFFKAIEDTFERIGKK